MKICINLRVFSDQLFVSNMGCVLMEVATVGWGATAWWGVGGNSGGSTVGGGGVGLQPLRTALHTLIINPKQFERKQS